MRGPPLAWAPAGILAAGAFLSFESSAHPSLPLRVALGLAIPAQIAGYEGQDLSLSAGEQRVARVTSYLLRRYVALDTALRPSDASLYIGYYGRQTEGRAIHSPKNCLPGAGWETLASGTAVIPAPSGAVTVNRYLLQNGAQRALVLYWYQGRGRIVASEYVVKWDLLRDSALRRRSDEALVRIVLPLTNSEDRAFTTAVEIARVIIPALERALPT